MTVMMKPLPPNPELERLIEWAREQPPMTPEQVAAQKRSWVIGEMMIEHPTMTREYAEFIYESVSR